MLVSPIPPSSLDTYCLSTSSLWCKVLCIVISFLVLWFPCSSLVHFKNDSEYLTRGTAQVFLFLLCVSYNIVWFWVAFLLSKDTLYSFFFHLPLFDGVRFQYPQVFVSFLFSEHSKFFLIWLLHSVRHVSRLPLFIISMVYFSMLNSIPIFGLYFLTVCIRLSNFVFVFGKQFDAIRVHWVIDIF